jgi:hypothetical protein
VTVLVSLDIDGTMEFGRPAGPVLLQHVREVRRRGYVVGSASDCTVSEQTQLWQAAGIDVDFVGHKHHLDRVRARFQCARYLHIGDGDADEYYARLFGFEFWHVDGLPAASTAGWVY